MDAVDITSLLYSRLEERGSRGRVVSLHHRVASVREEIERRHGSGDLDEAFYRTHLARFGATEHNSLDGPSVIVVSAPQPQQRVTFHRIASYVSDLPAALDVWHESGMMARCERCAACFDSCPTGAIGPDRFLLRSERRLTLHNEADEAFPDWIDPSWHHCLVGCMRCQLCCPVNKPFWAWFEDAGEFSEQETEMILSGRLRAGLPEPTARKLARLWLLDDVPLVSRNLSALLERPAS